jgi:hypothetical protein
MLDALLRRGYLPERLPPIFSTALFADCIGQNPGKLPQSFVQNRAPWTESLSHDSFKNGLRRRMSIPNPINYVRISSVFDENQLELTNQWAKSGYSLTTPSVNGAIIRGIAPDLGETATARAMVRVGAQYLLKVDVAQFYPSLYTHTIPWALHSKTVAKARKSDQTLLGNHIDKEIQDSQNGQTKGIAIGPDTSLGVAEVILSVIDEIVAQDQKAVAGVRIIDDLELGFRRVADAEETLWQLESLLHDYELHLNSEKTEIVHLPCALEPAFVSMLRPLIPSSTNGSRAQWVDFFS